MLIEGTGYAGAYFITRGGLDLSRAVFGFLSGIFAG